jgi:choline kinase
MRAIILAAGIGRRLDGRLGSKPKGLLILGGEPRGESLLGRLLRALGAAGIREAVVVVGHGAERVRESIGSSWGGVDVRYVYNADYTKGAILSLWCARAALTGSLLVMDSDVLCPPEFISRLVSSPHANCFLLDGTVRPSGEEQILMARGGRVYNIAKTRTVDPGYDTVGESVGFLKVASDDASVLRELVEEAVAAGRDDTEYEDVFPEFMRRCIVGYECVDGAPWIEIDFPEDIERAERDLLPRLCLHPSSASTSN